MHANDGLDRRGVLQRGLTAIERVAGAHEIEMEIPTEHQAVGGGKAGARGRQAGAQAQKDVELLPVHGMGRIVGTGEVAHDERDVEPLQQRCVACELAHFLCCHAEPVQPGVDVQRRRRGTRAIVGQRRPRMRVGEIGERPA